MEMREMFRDTWSGLSDSASSSSGSEEGEQEGLMEEEETVQKAKVL